MRWIKQTDGFLSLHAGLGGDGLLTNVDHVPLASDRHQPLNELAARGLNRGIATQCIGGGEATAVAVEML